jgi:hypothetical protein
MRCILSAGRNIKTQRQVPARAGRLPSHFEEQVVVEFLAWLQYLHSVGVLEVFSIVLLRTKVNKRRHPGERITKALNTPSIPTLQHLSDLRKTRYHQNHDF